MILKVLLFLLLDTGKTKRLNLDEIIEILEDDTTVKGVIKKNEEARDSHKLDNKEVTNYSELLDKVRDYIKHHKKIVDGVEVEDYQATSEAYTFLINYGASLLGKNPDEVKAKDAIKAALKHAKKGKVADIFDLYKRTQNEISERAYSQAVIAEHVNPLDHDHLTSLAQNYIDKHASLLEGDKLKNLKKLPAQALAHEALDLLHEHRAAKAAYKETVTHRTDT